eukprot:CAMPEP_0178510288 /NCGR_PEP_ID=MMETSP0696-20121128/21749_1 /TAXON_ID=265572 /ORGANISM="Extubocellulus spinifer, Strain CCMP396" /LENGTH=154 /DNA_ID=CAMNT_0020139985 /DNA_START=74 /DNA_END=536 /DNA_ORIENTATION=-
MAEGCSPRRSTSELRRSMRSTSRSSNTDHVDEEAEAAVSPEIGGEPVVRGKGANRKFSGRADQTQDAVRSTAISSSTSAFRPTIKEGMIGEFNFNEAAVSPEIGGEPVVRGKGANHRTLLDLAALTQDTARSTARSSSTTSSTFRPTIKEGMIG